MKTIKLTGPFSDADIAEFVALLRRIDDASPGGVYAISVTDPDMASMDKAERFLASMSMSTRSQVSARMAPERAPVARASYRDDHYPARACDCCGRSYQGPAVYCSFECAIADA